MNDLILKIQQSADKNILFTMHSAQQCVKQNRMISPNEIHKVIKTCEIIEDYPFDTRGHTCLISGKGNDKRPIHLVCFPTDNFLQIITAYLPEEKKWDDNSKNREDTWNV
ncbi:MAG TPA: DUF4258 domain-containing protein [Ignavibacteria bacterium]|nr:DUF4258 domain-containing protein [Ignavibacteria bacterium]